MGRVNPVAVVYKLTNVIDGMIYIGETSNFADRMSAYRSVSKGTTNANHNDAIHNAMRKFGFDSFAIEVLESSIDNESIKDYGYRHDREAYYIEKYHATDPTIGYNMQTRNYSGPKRGRRKGIKTATRTKILKSNTIIAYKMKTKGCSIILGTESAATLLGFTDRAIIVRCIHNGKSSHGYYFFRIDFGARLDDATNIISRRMDKSNPRFDYNGKRAVALGKYIDALNAVNEFCSEVGYDTVDIDAIIAKLK